MPPVSFNNREIASGIWLGGFLLYFLATNASIRSSVANLVKMFSKPKLAGSFAFMAVYMTAIVFGLYRIGLWEPFLLKTTIVWFLFTGAVNAVNAIGTRSTDQSISKFIADNVKVIILIEFLVGTYTFSLPVELILVPVAGFLAGLDAVAQRDEEFSSVAKLTSGLLATLGLTVVVSAAIKAIRDFQTFASFASLREVLLAPGLALMFVPCIYTLALYAAYDSLWIRMKIGPDVEPDAKLYAMRQFVKLCGLRVGKVRNLVSNNPGALMRIQTREDVDRFVETSL